MERHNGAKASSTRVILTRKRASLQQGSISNTKPHTVELDPLTFLANTVDGGSWDRSNTHAKKKHSSSAIGGLPSDGPVRPDADYEGVLRLPFVEPGSLKDQSNKLKKLKRKLDSMNATQPPHTKTALQTASGSRAAILRSLDGVSSNGVLQKQTSDKIGTNSGADRGGKRPCREEEGRSKGLIASPLNSEHVTSSSSSDSSLQLVPVDVLSSAIQNGPPSPSSSQSQPSCPDPPNHHPGDDSNSTPSASASSSKILISPNGSGFYPNHIEVIHCISRVIQSKFEEPWPTWSKVPRNVRDHWFDEFQKHYYWEPQHARQIRLNFDARGSGRLVDMFREARKEINVRPFWLSPEVWDALKQYWASPRFQNRSKQARINRGSDCDGLGPSLHTCGSIPMSEHKRRLEEETGEEVTPIKLFVHTHQRKKDKTWVDARSSQAYEKFMKKWNALQFRKENPSDLDTQAEEQTSAQPEPTATQPDTQLSEGELWAKTNTTKRGAIYGLGSEAVHYKHHSNPSTSRSTDKQQNRAWFDTPEFQEFLNRKVMEISSEWRARLEEEQRKTEELQKRVAELEKEKQAKKSKKKKKKKMRQMEEMMKMLQRSYESLSKAQPSASDSDEDDDDDDDDSADSE